MRRDKIDIWSKGEVATYLGELAKAGQIKKCTHLMLEHGHANAYYPRCEKKWASRVSANNVPTDITAYNGPSSYSWPKCPEDCPHFIESENFISSVSRDQYDGWDEDIAVGSTSNTEKEPIKEEAMSEFELNDEQLNKIKEEVSHWQDFLNLTVGTLSFTMGLATLSLNPSSFFAWVAVGFLLILIFPNLKKWPPTLNGLKEKKNKSERERIIYQGLMAEFFGFKALAKNFSAYWFGLVFLILVAAGVVEKIAKYFA
jgi:hypothetical protein